MISGLGPIDKVSILQARETAAEYRSKAYRSIDPTEEKRKARQAHKVPTFETAANAVYAQRRAGWSNGKHVEQWINTLQDFAFPLIGKKLVCDIGTPEVLQVLTPIWLAKPETARRVRQRMGLILDWARVAGHRSGDNPTDLIGNALPRHKKNSITMLRCLMQKLVLSSPSCARPARCLSLPARPRARRSERAARPARITNHHHHSTMTDLRPARARAALHHLP